MNHFSLTLIDGQGSQTFAQIGKFVAADADGSFTVMAGHCHLLAKLKTGLARFCDDRQIWHYLALPGAVLRFCDNQMTVTTVRFFLGSDETALLAQLEQELQRQDSDIYLAEQTLNRIEQSLKLQLLALGKHKGA